MATLQESVASIEDTSIFPKTEWISQEKFVLNQQSGLASSNCDIPNRDHQGRQNGLYISYESDAEASCKSHPSKPSDGTEENHQQSISSSRNALETYQSSPLRSHSTHNLSSSIISNSVEDDDQMLRGRTRTRAGSEATPSEHLFNSGSRASSPATDSATERSDSVFSPLKLQHREWSRNGSPSHSDDYFPEPKPITETKGQILNQVNEFTLSDNFVPCLQCLNTGLRCSFSIRLIKDRTCCTRCRGKGDPICIARVFAGFNGKGEKKYEFSTDFEKFEKEPFERRLKELQEEKWIRDRFALPKPQPGYMFRLKNWRETSVEKRQRLKDCHFVVT